MSIFKGTTEPKKIYIRVPFRGAMVDFLLVGGGGGGGGSYNLNLGGGGGGGGGFIECMNCELGVGEYCVIVGSRGAGGVDGSSSGCNGGDTTFNGLTACGGGGGGGRLHVGSSGASGGGGGPNCCAGGTGTSGCNGGKAENYPGGGGGGVSSAGGTGSTYVGGAGGNGKCSCISGNLERYSGGGPGGGYRTCAWAACGCGGGQNCCGGGGVGGQYCYGGNVGYQGGCGVFILRYPTACGFDVSGGTCYTCGGYTIHCFTSNGTLTIN